MPSASQKSEKMAPIESTDPIKQAISVMEKKVRNLEKRKSKLDGYRQRKDAGEELDDSQKEAVAKFDGVVQTLEFARDLQKQFASIETESDRRVKKQAKRERQEKQDGDTRRLRDVIQLQKTLDVLRLESFRRDFAGGAKGAVGLTAQELDGLKELHDLLNPAGENLDFLEQVNKVCDHIQALLDAKEKAVGGGTYKELKAVLDRVYSCEYFKHPVDFCPPSESHATVSKEDKSSEKPQPFVVKEAESDAGLTRFPRPELPPQQHPQPELRQKNGPKSAEEHNNQVNAAVAPDNEHFRSDSTFYRPATSSAAEEAEVALSRQHPEQTTRALDDIVSSLKGPYNFLQDSEIDLESPHNLDPAVVAASHPLHRPVAPPSDAAAFAQDGRVERLSSGSQSQAAAEAAAKAVLESPPAQFDAAQSFARYDADAGFDILAADAPFVDKADWAEQSAGLAAGPPPPIELPTSGAPRAGYGAAVYEDSGASGPRRDDARADLRSYEYAGSFEENGGFRGPQTFENSNYGGYKNNYSGSIQDDFEAAGNFGGNWQQQSNSSSRYGNQRGGGYRSNRAGGPSNGYNGVTNGYRGSRGGRGGFQGNRGASSAFQNTRGHPRGASQGPQRGAAPPGRGSSRGWGRPN